jgi:hypothetical protein
MAKSTDFEENDLARRNAIANLLEEWDLVEIVNPEQSEYPVQHHCLRLRSSLTEKRRLGTNC